MARTKVEDGVWVQPRRREYELECCDCGLVHTLNFRIYHGHIQFQAFRDNRSTAQMRRWQRKREAEGPK